MQPSVPPLLPRNDGAALVAVLLLLMMLTTLVVALSLAAQTDSLIARNHRSAALARTAAEAGLSHGVQLAVTFLADWKMNGFATSRAAVEALLAGPDGLTGDAEFDADNGSLGVRDGIEAGEAIPPGTHVALGTAFGVGYRAVVVDDDDVGGVGEDDDPYSDTNQHLVIRAIGYGPDRATVTLEAVIRPAPLPALLSGGDIELAGSIGIHGPDPPLDGVAIHSNRDLRIAGNGVEATGRVTASGAFGSDNDDIHGTGGVQLVDIPPVNAADHDPAAGRLPTSRRFRLRTDGTVINLDTGVVCSVSSAFAQCGVSGWSLSDGEWSTSGPTAGTYYVEGDVRVSGSVGNAKTPLALSLIAEGNIHISGALHLVPDAEGLLFVTNRDLRVAGNLTAGQGQALVLVREQLDLGGNITLAGRIEAANAASAGNLVTTNRIHGNVLVRYDGSLDANRYIVAGWRQVRAAR
jgi:hypothetical protein